jgi:ATP-binding cassette subfamily F protein uup
VKSLSGGERNRLLLARLFARPANLLVLDEPTNDLDVETLELLEELLSTFDGTVLLVSHDRAFLDHVVTSTLVFEGDGAVNEYVGGYADWLRQRKMPVSPSPVRANSDAPAAAAAAPAIGAVAVPTPVPRPKKLSYKDQRDLEQLPARIEALEKEQAQIHVSLADPALYQKGGDALNALQARMSALEGELASAYERWEALESLGG